MTGMVYLVGAGPGDPDLITVRGLNLIRRADVIIHDRLIPHALLDHARADCEKIDAGKLPQKHRLSQDEITAAIIQHARRGKTVVRLKGGDPFVFGRGGEEALACYAAGIPFEIVPGVTSAVAVPAYAGVPVTQRGIAAAFTVFAGHEDPSKPESSIDYSALAAAAKLGTLVLLMGVANLATICDQLISSGVSPDMPAICIEWGTTAQQRTVAGSLATIADTAASSAIQPPAITVIGAAVRLREQGLAWFSS